jgi:hypothetical protein
VHECVAISQPPASAWHTKQKQITAMQELTQTSLAAAAAFVSRFLLLMPAMPQCRAAAEACDIIT